MAIRSAVLRLQPRMGARALSVPALAATDLPAIAGAAMTTTPAGLRIASITTPGSTATVTAWVEAGSRYETPETNGVANLLETAAMSSKAAEIAALGGMVSSYTTREFIVFEAKVLKEKVPEATKLLGELCAPAGDVGAAKSSMLAAIETAAASPDEVLMEHLHDAAYLDSPMGMSVLGTAETVGSLTAGDVKAFAAANVTSTRTVVTAAGAVDGDAFAKAALEAFGGLPSPAAGGDVVDAALAPSMFTGSDKRIRFDSFPSAHVALAFETSGGASSSDSVPLMVMAAYLGSFDTATATVLPKNRTSMLVMDQGEQAAAASLQVLNCSYKDSGLFGVYFSAVDNRVEDSMWYTLWNLVRLVHKTTDKDVEFAKLQLKSQLAADLGTSAGLAADLAKSISYHGRPVSLEEMYARIDAVTADTVKATAKKVINDQDHALAAVGPIYELPDYNWIRRRSHWLRY